MWPFTYEPESRRFTTVSAWLGGEYVTENGHILYRNDKSISFLRFSDLATRTSSELELTIYLEGRKDRADRILLEGKGWRIRHALDVANSPENYRRYIRSSRGEFSCAKPSCMALQNAWVSDRTLCYLASGRTGNRGELLRCEDRPLGRPRARLARRLRRPRTPPYSDRG
jgi:hypothetical protein